jgi:hypothetical protein
VFAIGLGAESAPPPDDEAALSALFDRYLENTPTLAVAYSNVMALPATG